MTIQGNLDMSGNHFAFAEKPASLRRLNVSKSFLLDLSSRRAAWMCAKAVSTIYP